VLALRFQAEEVSAFQSDGIKGKWTTPDQQPDVAVAAESYLDNLRAAIQLTRDHCLAQSRSQCTKSRL
jgi:hypothetical protein